MHETRQKDLFLCLCHGWLISHHWQFQTGHCMWVCGKRRFDVRTFPDVAGIVAAHVRKSRQDTAGETVQAAIHTDLAFERSAEILKEEVLADRSRNMFPWEDFIRAALTVRVKEWVESVFFEGLDPRLHAFALIPGIKFRTFFPGRINHFCHAPVAPR